jgi:sRNA-binding protein
MGTFALPHVSANFIHREKAQKTKNKKQKNKKTQKQKKRNKAKSKKQIPTNKQINKKSPPPTKTINQTPQNPLFLMSSWFSTQVVCSSIIKWAAVSFTVAKYVPQCHQSAARESV